MLPSVENTNTKIQERLLFVFPALYILCGIYFRWLMGGYYTVAIDPEYSYLFNGANVAQFSFKVWHVDHPGTPLQLISGIVIRVVYMLTGKESIASDVVARPELYLGAINFALFFLNGTALYFLGRITFRSTGKVLQALFLQLTPFISFTLFTIILRVSVEQTVLLAALLLLIWLVKFLYDENTSPNRYVIAFALIIGLAVSSKIIAAPLFFIPLCLLPGYRRKVAYAGATLAAFILYILPVLVYRYEYFAEWISNLLFHSGKYGNGTEEIVDKGLYIANLKDIFSQDIIYTAAVILGIIAMMFYPIPRIRKRLNNDKVYRMICGVTLATLFNALMIAKHYTYYYLVTSLSLNVFLLYLLYRLFNVRLSFWLATALFVIITFALGYSTITEFGTLNKARLAVKKERAKTDAYIAWLPADKKMLAIADYYGSAYRENAVTFGLFWSGNYYRAEYMKGAAAAYPNTFLYSDYDKKFHDWKDGSFSIHELMKENDQLLLYSNLPDVTFMVPGMRPGPTQEVEVREVYNNGALHEAIYVLDKKAGVTANGLIFKCDADSLAPDPNYFQGTGGMRFLNDNNRTAEKARSGKYSAKLLKPHEFGMSCTLGPLPAQDVVYISVWRHTSNKDGALILSAHDSKKLYMGTEKPVATEGEWEKLLIEYTVTPEMQNEELVIYVWGHSARPVYFDDLEIEKISP